jgi:serine protease Do
MNSMRYSHAYGVAVLAIALITPFSLAQDSLALKSPSSRKTLLVKVVEKTVTGVVAVRVPRQGERDMIGSGIIFHQAGDIGLIVTNRHVTGGKKELKIRLNDGTDLVGKVTLTDPDLDLAILQIKTAKKLTLLSFAPIDFMVGEDVIAIGSPYGYEATVSRGIISALHREITMPNDVVMKNLIQTDAPINPGNSGGPLVNMDAQVIGINVAMRDGAQNIAFTIDAGTVKDFTSRYLKGTSGVAHGLKYEEKVQTVIVKNSAQPVLKSGDEIRTIADCRVSNAVDIERAFWGTKPGEQIAVKVNRQGQEMTVMLTLEASQGAGSVASVSTETPTANAATTKVRTVIGR